MMDDMKFELMINFSEQRFQAIDRNFPRYINNPCYHLNNEDNKLVLGDKVIENYYPLYELPNNPICVCCDKIIHNPGENKHKRTYICCVNVGGHIFCNYCFQGAHDDMRLIELQIEPFVNIHKIIRDFIYFTIKCPLLNIIITDIIITRNNKYMEHLTLDQQMIYSNKTIKVPFCIAKKYYDKKKNEKKQLRKKIDTIFKDVSYIIVDYLCDEIPDYFK